jgi:hypothetical protein
MEAKDPVHSWSFKSSFMAHAIGPGPALLGWLKNKLNRSTQFSFARLEQPSRSQKHGRVTVVSAGVHFGINFTAKRDLRFLLNWKRIHIRTQSDAWAGFVSECRHDSRLCEWVAVADAQAIKCGSDELTGLAFFVHQLWMAMDQSP